MILILFEELYLWKKLKKLVEGKVDFDEPKFKEDLEKVEKNSGGTSSTSRNTKPNEQRGSKFIADNLRPLWKTSWQVKKNNGTNTSTTRKGFSNLTEYSDEKKRNYETDVSALEVRYDNGHFQKSTKPS